MSEKFFTDLKDLIVGPLIILLIWTKNSIIEFIISKEKEIGIITTIFDSGIKLLTSFIIMIIVLFRLKKIIIESRKIKDEQ